jgi:hypothetical protein
MKEIFAQLIYNQKNVVCFLLGDTLASEDYMPTFLNTMFHLHRRVGMKNEDGTDSVFQNVGI